MNDDPLYREIILEHWASPQNYGVIKNPDFTFKDNNPTCGDNIKITGKIKNGKLIEIKFQSEGCAISKASASLFTEKIKGIELSKLSKMSEKDALDALPIEITPARFNCALLCFRALHQKSLINV
jgi:nitrogen fixation NifU-like protein